MVLGFALAVGLPVVVLTCIAMQVVTVVNISSLRIPIPLTIQILTAILPLVAGLNTLYRPTRPNQTQSFIFTALQALQGLLTTILATLFLEHVPSSDTQSCMLSTTWDRFWKSKDSIAIRQIQDSLDCCGFNSLKDRPWPFPQGQGSDLLACSHKFHRTTPCSALWMGSMKKDAGVAFVVIVLVGVFQVANLIYGRPNPLSDNWVLPEAFKWMRGGHSQVVSDNRRLLTEGEEEETQIEPLPYRDEDPENQNHQEPGEEDHDTIGPRVEPAGMGHHESNESHEWRRA